jgi:uncharacterized protein YyaL (SSP411 family)
MCKELQKKLVDKFIKSDYLIHSYRNENDFIYGTLTDYAYYMLFLINLYQYEGENSFINDAVKIMDLVISNFWDIENYGFFDTDFRFNKLPVRSKQIYNTSSVPSNALIMNVLIKLYEITGDQKYYTYATNMGVAFSDIINKNPLATISLVSSLSKIKSGSYVISMPKVFDNRSITAKDILGNTPFDAIIKYNDDDIDKSKNIYLKVGNKSIEPVETSKILRRRFFDNKMR